LKYERLIGVSAVTVTRDWPNGAFLVGSQRAAAVVVSACFSVNSIELQGCRIPFRVSAEPPDGGIDETGKQDSSQYHFPGVKRRGA